MNQYKIVVTYSVLDSESNFVNKTMPFVVSTTSLEEARTLAQEASMKYINKINGIFVSAE